MLDDFAHGLLCASAVCLIASDNPWLSLIGYVLLVLCIMRIQQKARR